jgi:hypothetical protein
MGLIFEGERKCLGVLDSWREKVFYRELSSKVPFGFEIITRLCLLLLQQF